MAGTDSDMAILVSRVRSQLPSLTTALETFQASSSAFSILRTINRPTSPTIPKTLFVLDSSFNPPSRAHLTLATSVLTREANKPNGGLQKYAEPWRLLLLFSTHNADKAPSAASFEQRLAMMCVFADDLLDVLRGCGQLSTGVAIDIGVTTQPYYTDKSAAIESSSPMYYPSAPHHPRHVHLCGFDTLTRILNPKYYASFSPPLSALAPYFSAGHGFRVMQRPDEEYGSAEQQDQLLRDLAGGSMRQLGGMEEWTMKIDMVRGDEAIGISSTRVRKAAKAGDWMEVRRLCTTGVAEWVKLQAIYKTDDRGAKMA
ncbi:MAG: hypothetical protein M1821_007823 [Bathelium mastoideum]|nr:MAG: hypothetical protein M1821_007823 [Bathelium mastoideum]KAI9688580.1 MAG: hypothetical protein M1822_001529 [Bathelium mastoideum]